MKKETFLNANKELFAEYLQDNKNLTSFARVLDVEIKNHHKIAIFYHLRPDGDAFASAFAFKNLITENYKDKDVIIVHTENIDDFNHLSTTEKQKVLNIQKNNQKANKRLTEKLPTTPEEIVKTRTIEKIANLDNINGIYDLVWDYLNGPKYSEFFKSTEEILAITVDTSILERINGANYLMKCGTKLMVDHHVKTTDEKWVNDRFQDETLSSNCEAIVMLALVLNWKLSADTARHLYLGFLTDSNRYLYQNVDEISLSCMQVLLATGFDRWELQNALYQRDENVIDYQNEIFKNRASVDVDEKRIIYAVLEKNAHEKYGLKSGAGQVNVLANLKNGEIWFLPIYDPLIEKYRVSARSKNVDLTPVLKKYAGGGHKNAGSMIINDLSELKNVLNDFKALLKNQHLKVSKIKNQL